MAKDNLTKPRINAFKCPPERAQAFLWDLEVNGLGVRATPRGQTAFVFQRQHLGKTVRITIGGTDAWTIPEARMKAREIQRQMDQGENPVAAKQEKIAATHVENERRKTQGITVGELWPIYLEEGRPKGKDSFRPRYLNDLRLMASPGGHAKKRGKGLTKPGPIYPLLSMAISELDEDGLLAWYKVQEARGRAQAARALMMFRGFLRWCLAQPQYRSLAKPVQESARSPALVGELPAQKRRTDVIEPSQLAGWWAAVLQLPNPHISAYLRALAMTGLRREAMANLKWSEIDFRWKKATFTDKVFGTRVIPLGDVLLNIIKSLPKEGDFVFAGRGKTGHIADPRASLKSSLAACGLGHVTVHGLRRTFALLSEESGVPTGAAAQYMGHRPSGTHEGYKPRSTEQLRVYILRIEARLQQLLGMDEPVGDGAA